MRRLSFFGILSEQAQEEMKMPLNVTDEFHSWRVWIETLFLSVDQIVESGSYAFG